MRYYLQSLFILTLLLLIGANAFSQEQPGLRDRADELYRKYEYANAAKIYTKLADTSKPRLEDLERLADSYWRMNDYQAAENWYARVVEMEGSTANHHLRYGDVLKANGKYVEAKRQLWKYAEATGNYDAVAVAIAGCDSATVWMADPTTHKLRNEELNSSLSEFSVFPQGDLVYYVGEPDGYMKGAARYGWTGHSFLRVYTADRLDDNTLINPVLAIESINDARYHVGPVAANATGDTLYVTRTHPGKESSIEK